MYKLDISSMPLKELEDWSAKQNLPSFRAKQIYDWLHKKQVTSFSQITNLPKNILAMLNETCFVFMPQIKQKQISLDGTIKYLLELQDGNCIETVLMRYNHGNSICVSSQVGCRMGCKFCASTQGGLVRSLSASEIAAQIYVVKADINERISNIVLMGIGEPLDNFDNVVDFLNIITSKEGECIGARNISISTCGIVPEIDRLAKLRYQITLSVSLHAPFDDMRSAMMPINNKYNIFELMNACKRYQKQTGRRISFEYSMVKSVNDSQAAAKQLAKLLKGMSAHVNLIPINPVDGSPYGASDDRNINRFKNLLLNLGVNATLRRRLGTDIDAACGQLRRADIKLNEQTN